MLLFIIEAYHYVASIIRMKMEDDRYVLNGPPPLEPIPECSLGQLIFKQISGDVDAEILIDSVSGDSITSKALLAKSCLVAENLRLWGFGDGSIVGICSENCKEFFLPVLGALFVGAVVAPISQNYTETELLHNLHLTKPRVIFCSRAVLPTFQKIKSKVKFIEKLVPIDDCSNGFTAPAPDLSSFQIAQVNPREHVAFIMSSSGTTGLPKGVMLTHRNIIANLIMSKDWRFFNQDKNLSTLGYLPFYHSYGMFRALSCILRNVKIIVMPKFEEKSFLANIEKYKITTLSLVPAIAILLARSPQVDNYNLSSVVEVSCGAAPLGKDIEETLKNRLRLKIKSVNQAYGATEFTLRVTGFRVGDHKFGSSGKLVPFVSCKIRDPATGKSLGPNHVGELCFKGPLVMKGYYNNEEATKACFTADGWLMSGDLGYYDKDEYFYIVDRLKELIKYKGFQVAPAELEAVLLTHPKIKDCGVVGVPNAEAGELPLAFIVVNPNTQLTESQVKQFIAERLSPHKRLRGGVRFVSEIPKSPSGKILRRKLKQLLTENKSKL